MQFYIAYTHNSISLARDFLPRYEPSGGYRRDPPPWFPRNTRTVELQHISGRPYLAQSHTLQNPDIRFTDPSNSESCTETETSRSNSVQSLIEPVAEAEVEMSRDQIVNRDLKTETNDLGR